jgi:metal-responsive CopG/Arc/MetJ family transcriptional regulator
MTKTVEMAFDETLLAQVDETARQFQLSRTDFVRKAIEDALQFYRVKRLEEDHVASYSVYPQTEDEVAEWADIRDWETIPTTSPKR